MKHLYTVVMILMIPFFSFSHSHAKLYEGGENLDADEILLSAGASFDSSAIGASLKLAYGINDTMSAGLNLSSALVLNMASLEYRVKLAGNETHHLNAKVEAIYNQFVWTEYLHQLSIEPSLQYLFKMNDRFGVGLDLGFFIPFVSSYSDKDKLFPHMLTGLANLNIRVWNQNSLHFAFGPAFDVRQKIKSADRDNMYFGKLMLSILF